MAELIIPGLPDDIALRCLVRVPPRLHAKLSMICSAWKQAVSSTPFKLLHQSLDLPSARAFLVLMDASEDAERFPARVNATVLDIASGGLVRTVCFANPDISSFRESIFLAGRASVSYHSQIFVFGGYTMGYVSDRLHIFDILSRTWSVGLAMSIPRAEFGYGIIGNRIFVAGGFFSADDTQDPADFFTTRAEMYDIVEREWVRIADMPFALKCDFSWTRHGKFFIRGCYFDDSGNRLSKVMSYNPPVDSWEDEPLMCHLLRNLKPLSITKIVAVGKEEKLYMAEMKMSMCSPSSSLFEVKKLTEAAQTWDSIMKTSDESEHFGFSCEDNMTPAVYALKDGVLAILHGMPSYSQFDTEGIEFMQSVGDVVEVHMSCPFSCIATVVFV